VYPAGSAFGDSLGHSRGTSSNGGRKPSSATRSIAQSTIGSTGAAGTLAVEGAWAAASDAPPASVVGAAASLVALDALDVLEVRAPCALDADALGSGVGVAVCGDPQAAASTAASTLANARRSREPSREAIGREERAIVREVYTVAASV
jgi:hypothetical protein